MSIQKSQDNNEVYLKFIGMVLAVGGLVWVLQGPMRGGCKYLECGLRYPQKTSETLVVMKKVLIVQLKYHTTSVSFILLNKLSDILNYHAI